METPSRIARAARMGLKIIAIPLLVLAALVRVSDLGGWVDVAFFSLLGIAIVFLLLAGKLNSTSK